MGPSGPCHSHAATLFIAWQAAKTSSERCVRSALASRLLPGAFGDLQELLDVGFVQFAGAMADQLLQGLIPLLQLLFLTMGQLVEPANLTRRVILLDCLAHDDAQPNLACGQEHDLQIRIDHAGLGDHLLGRVGLIDEQQRVGPAALTGPTQLGQTRLGPAGCIDLEPAGLVAIGREGLESDRSNRPGH